MSAGHTSLLQFLIDICSTARDSGMRRLFLLNGHAGNTDILGQLARHLSTLSDAPVGHGSYWTVAASEITERRPAPIHRIPGHAGEFETSLMQALRPELVGSTSELSGDVGAPPALVDGLTIEQVTRRVGVMVTPTDLRTRRQKPVRHYCQPSSPRCSGPRTAALLGGIGNLDVEWNSAQAS